MKLCTFIIVFFIVLNGSCQSENPFEQVAEANIDQQRLQFAKEMAFKLLSAQKQGGYYELSNEEATDQMIVGLDEGIQKQSYATIKSLFGDFEDMELDHVLATNKETGYEIYRFRGVFERPAQVEIRSVLDAQGKLAGFYVKPWKDQL